MAGSCTVTALREAVLADLDPATLYRILALRAEIFVVEQACAYLDPDGRDLEPSTVQVWLEEGDRVLATLRLMRDAGNVAHIGRVATAVHARGRGLAERLVRRALELAGPVDVVLGAQTYLEGWYARFGFVRDGADYDEDGIPHLPMRLHRIQSGA